MNSDQLDVMGRRLIGKNFLGVFPLNALPKQLKVPSYFIVNTHTINLPGEHWLAVAYQNRGVVDVFDSFGYYYPIPLIRYLKPYGRLNLSRKRIQHPFSTACGLHSITWLRYDISLFTSYYFINIFFSSSVN